MLQVCLQCTQATILSICSIIRCVSGVLTHKRALQEATLNNAALARFITENDVEAVGQACPGFKSVGLIHLAKKYALFFYLSYGRTWNARQREIEHPVEPQQSPVTTRRENLIIIGQNLPFRKQCRWYDLYYFLSFSYQTHFHFVGRGGQTFRLLRSEQEHPIAYGNVIP